MIDITIDTHDLDRVLADLGDAEFLRDPMEAGLAILHDFMAQYPPPPARSQYRRTGNYGRLWTERVFTSGRELVGELGNAVRDRRGRSYGPYVGADPGGPEPNQNYHNRHWRTDREAVEQNEAQIRRYFDDAIQRVLDR